MISDSPAWKVFPDLLPRPTHKDYLYALETMNRREARQLWREGIKACWNHQCAYCNGVPIDDASLTMDHIVPKAHAGEDLTSNLVPACSRCNNSKGSEEWHSWFRKQDFYSPMRELEIEAWMAQCRRYDYEPWEEYIEQFHRDVSFSLDRPLPESVLATR